MMDYVFKQGVWAPVVISCLLFLSACSESLPPKEAKVNSLPFVSPLALNKSIIRTKGAWDAPTKLGDAVFSASIESHAAEPVLLRDQQNNVLSYWRLHSAYEPQTSSFTNTQNRLFQFQAVNQSWNELTQFPAATTPAIVRQEKISGDIYALWFESDRIQFSRYQTASQWQPPQVLNDGQWGDIALNDQGDAAVFAINHQDNGLYSISVSLLSNAIVKAQSENLIRTNPINRMAVLLDNAKQATVVWQEISEGINTFWSAQYSASGGWRFVQQLEMDSQISSSTITDMKLVENLLNGGLEFVFSQQNTRSISLLSMSYVNGRWSPANILAQANDRVKQGESASNITANTLGSIAIVWRERQLIGAQDYLQFKTRVFQPATGWGITSVIGQPVPDVITISNPKITLGDAEELSVSWIENGQGRSDLLVSQFNKTTAMWETPELVVSYDRVQASVLSTSIMLDSAGKAMVAWQQERNTPVNKEFHFWFSRVAGSGTIVEEPIQLNSIAASDIVMPSAVWQAPVDVWTDTILSNTVSLIHGPHLEASDSATGFLFLYKNSDFNPLTGGYLNQENIVLNNSGPGVWTADQPFPTTGGVSNRNIEIKIATNGDAFALWQVYETLYFNHYVNGVGWGAEINIGPNDNSQDLMIDATGNVWIFWVFGGDINLQQYIPGTSPNAGLQAADVNSIPNAWFYSTPVIDEAGIINIAWISLSTQGSQPFTSTNFLNIIQYTPGTGWGFVEKAPPLNSFNAMGSQLYLAATSSDEVMAVSQDNHGNIFAISFSPTKSWSLWENVDYNLDKSDRVARTAQVSRNGPDNIMVIWSEETLDLDGSPVFRIYSNRYVPLGDANGSRWPLPERVGAIVPQFDTAGIQLKQYQTLPKIALLADGRAFAAWLDSSELKSDLYANQYTPGTGWSATPDQVISYDRLTTGKVKSPDIAALSSGKVLLSWRQEISTEFANEIHVWVTEGQL